MKNSIPSVGTTVEKSTKVETQHSSSHSDGNTHVGSSLSLSNDKETRISNCILSEIEVKPWVERMKLLYDSFGFNRATVSYLSEKLDSKKR
jgi:hypothetical protein